VVADNFEHVLAARNALEVKWATSAKAQGFDSETALNKTYKEIAGDKSAKTKSVKKKGDADAAFASAAKTYKADFKSDYAYHAQMEPLNAVARFNSNGSLEIWEGTQAPSWSRRNIAKAMRIKQSQINHHQQYMGGGSR
jgi:isoquinoline 1-oxidoreductase beta subunit